MLAVVVAGGQWWWVVTATVVAIGDSGDVAHLVFVDDGGGEKTTILGCLMMPNQALAHTKTRFGCTQSLINVYY